MKNLQFSLRSLFMLTAAVALFAAICQAFRWHSRVVVDSAVLSIAILLISKGIFDRKASMLLLGSVLLLTAAVLWIGALTMVAVWDGSGTRLAQVEVYDAVSKQPIANADVWFSHGESPSSIPNGNVGRTDSTGCATITLDVVCSGRDSIFGQTQHYWLRFDTIFCTAAGYRPMQSAAKERIDEKSLSRKVPVGPLRIGLEPIGSATSP